jgi:hypothetical protein
MAAPPGGPPDSTPPHIIFVRPESGAVVPTLKGDAVVQFDEVIDEMAGGGGGGGGGGGSGPGAVTGIGRQVVLSPVAGAVDVSWHRSAIHVRPAEGWKPDRVYHLEILGGIPDLRRNVMKQGAIVIFSTGPALPHAQIAGTALLWADQRALARGVIRAAPLPDTVAYVTLADSAGGFALRDVPPGRYRVWAIQDQNGNRRLDAREAFDSTTVAVDSSASVLLWAFVHDTVGPRLRSAEVVDSFACRLTFAQPLDPHRGLDTAAVHLYSLPDTAPVPISGVWSGTQYDSMQTRGRAVADSLRRAAARDTTGKRDTTARKPIAAAPGAPAPHAAGAPPAPSDTARARTDSLLRRLLRQRPVPSDRFVVRAAQPLAPGRRYLIRVHGVTNLSGAAASGQIMLAIPVPKPSPPAASRDTTRRKAGAKRP